MAGFPTANTLDHTTLTPSAFLLASQVSLRDQIQAGQLLLWIQGLLQLVAGQVSGLAPSATIDTTNASNVTAGLLPLPQTVMPFINPETAFNNTGPFTANSSNLVTITAAGITGTLPAPTAGTWVWVRMDPSCTQLLTIAPHSAEAINGFNVMHNRERALLVADGVNWTARFSNYVPMVGKLTYSGADVLVSPAATPVLVACNQAPIDNTGLMCNVGASKITCRRAGNYRVSVSDESFATTGGAAVTIMGFAADTATGTTTKYTRNVTFAPTGTGVVSPGNSAPFAIAAGADVSLWIEIINDTGKYRGTTNLDTFLALEEILPW